MRELSQFCLNSLSIYRLIISGSIVRNTIDGVVKPVRAIIPNSGCVIAFVADARFLCTFLTKTRGRGGEGGQGYVSRGNFAKLSRKPVAPISGRVRCPGPSVHPPVHSPSPACCHRGAYICSGQVDATYGGTAEGNICDVYDSRMERRACCMHVA